MGVDRLTFYLSDSPTVPAHSSFDIVRRVGRSPSPQLDDDSILLSDHGGLSFLAFVHLD